MMEPLWLQPSGYTHTQSIRSRGAKQVKDVAERRYCQARLLSMWPMWLSVGRKGAIISVMHLVGGSLSKRGWRERECMRRASKFEHSDGDGGQVKSERVVVGDVKCVGEAIILWGDVGCPCAPQLEPRPHSPAGVVVQRYCLQAR